MSRAVHVGINVDPATAGLDVARSLAEVADDAGLDIIGIQDHPYHPAHLDTPTLIADLAARTKRVRFFTNVADLPLRDPAMLARTAATLDIVSAGRFELGLGAGWKWDEICRLGGPKRQPAHAVDALDEAIRIVRQMWGQSPGEPMTGRFYSTDIETPGPLPVHDIGVWVGALGPRMLRLTGRAADGWSASVVRTPETQFSEMHDVIDGAAESAGRDPGIIRRILNVAGSIDATGSGTNNNGPVSYWINRLSLLTTTGRFDTVVFWPTGDVVSQARAFAESVAPAIRSTARATT